MLTTTTRAAAGAPAPGIPCAFCRKAELAWQNSGGTRRENAKVCFAVIASARLLTLPWRAGLSHIKEEAGPAVFVRPSFETAAYGVPSG